MTLIFPTNQGQRYYDTHYKFFYSLAAAAGIRVIKKKLKHSGRGFFIIYKDQKILIDFGDHKTVGANIDKFPICFRYHYSQGAHGNLKNCYPLTPISFYDWDRYFKLEKQTIYRAGGRQIQNNQRPGAAALHRRRLLQARLRERYQGRLDTSITGKVKFWQKIKTCLVSICVPGARNDILDRGQFQYMAFGACTISPPLDIVLPFWQRPEPGKHYLACKPDYSNLFEIIDWCEQNRDTCVEIGKNAKKLFLNTSIPDKVWEWINKCLEEKNEPRRNN